MDFINDWLPALSVIISAIISWVVAATKSKNELKKLKVEFEHQDKEKFSQVFADLMAATSNYCFIECQENLAKAIHANSNLLSFSPEQLLPLVQKMNVALNNEDIEEIKRIRNLLVSALSEMKQHT